tara:strand:- start:401 stop:613 length:213 start_codon:yes stop_codon:yes gene_type:complete
MKTIEITGITHNRGSEVLGVRLEASFKEWFCDAYSLKRWNHKKFQKVLIDSLKDAGIKTSAKKVKVEVLK